MKTKEQRQEDYRAKQKIKSKEVLERQLKRAARIEKNLMHKAVAMVSDSLEQAVQAADQHAALTQNSIQAGESVVLESVDAAE